MKLKTKTGTYISPNPRQGSFPNVFIEEVKTERQKNELMYTISFEMYYVKNGQRIVIAEMRRLFKGTNDDANGTNRKSMMRYPNPNFDPEFVGDETTKAEEFAAAYTEYFEVPLLEYLRANGGVMPKGAVITDIGFPSYTDLKDFFTGDSFGDEDITLTSPIAENWLLAQEMNGEKIGVQFEFEK